MPLPSRYAALKSSYSTTSGGVGRQCAPAHPAVRPNARQREYILSTSSLRQSASVEPSPHHGRCRGHPSPPSPPANAPFLLGAPALPRGEGENMESYFIGRRVRCVVLFIFCQDPCLRQRNSQLSSKLTLIYQAYNDCGLSLCQAPGRTGGCAGAQCCLTTARRAFVAGSPRPKAETGRTAAAVFGGAPKSSFQIRRRQG